MKFLFNLLLGAILGAGGLWYGLGTEKGQDLSDQLRAAIGTEIGPDFSDEPPITFGGG